MISVLPVVSHWCNRSGARPLDDTGARGKTLVQYHWGTRSLDYTGRVLQGICKGNGHADWLTGCCFLECHMFWLMLHEDHFH